MDNIISALERTLNDIDDLDRSIQGDKIDEPQILATKMLEIIMHNEAF